MVVADTVRSWVPFPAVPPAQAPELAVEHLRLRRFGAAADDLAVDLSGVSIANVTTAVLMACTERADGSPLSDRFLLALEVATRMECLLLLVALDSGDELAAVSNCANPSCARPIEIDLSIAELVALNRQRPEGPIAIDLRGEHLLFRRPTGQDQRDWASMRFADGDAVRFAILRTLTVSGIVPSTRVDFAAIETALDDGDPLIDFSLEVGCPFCGRTSRQTIDLASLALRRLSQAQSGLLETVHVLASHYHWSEVQILALPFWRRSRYLSLIERGGVG